MIHENIELTGSLEVSGSFILPLGGDSDREGSPITGSLFYNTASRAIEVYNGTTWVTQSLGGSGGDTPAASPIEYLVVAGGGGGGSYGGGGAGGYLSSSFSSLTSGSSYTITVGAAGAGSGNNYNDPGNAGGDSSISGTGITTVTATGGGHGGDNTGGSAAERGGDGGSGGGGSDGTSTPGSNAGGSGTTGQGNDGGDGAFSDPSYSGGGGGGAGTAGSNASSAVAGAGGNGLASSITGTSTTRAGGGGGVTFRSSDTQAAGGTGGGGEGGTWSGGTSTLSSNTAGTTNTGGGGGSGAAGGSGVVILAYDSGSHNAIGGQTGDAGNGRRYHQFNASSTFYFGGTDDFQIVTNGLYAHYDLSNADSYSGTGTTITDLAGSNNLTITSAPPFVNTHGGGLDFDGSADYAEVTGISYTPYVIDIWFNNHDTINTAQIQGNYQTLASFGSYPFGLNLGSWTSVFTNETVNMYTNGTAGGVYIRDTIATGTHNIVFAWTGTAWTVYVDGASKTVYTGGSSPQQLRAATAISMARGQGGNSYEFDGEIYEMKIYTSSLSTAQITQNYNARKDKYGL